MVTAAEAGATWEADSAVDMLEVVDSVVATSEVDTSSEAARVAVDSAAVLRSAEEVRPHLNFAAELPLMRPRRSKVEWDRPVAFQHRVGQPFIRVALRS